VFYHLLPTNDAYPHQNSLSCECCPEVDPMNLLLIIHQPYDNRPKPEEWLLEMVSREHQSS
jgi:hypothetical protein